MSEFKTPPLSVLCGSNLLNYRRVMQHGSVERAFYLKAFLTTLFVLGASPLHLWEKIYFKNKLARFEMTKEPLFILGLFRSGTTFLHNLLCQDPTAGYLTTYHSIFPNNLASGGLFKSFVRRNMTATRPTDNVAMGVDLPQEEEWAVLNLNAHSYYNMMLFPRQYERYYRESVGQGLSPDELERWKQDHRELVVKAMINTGGERAIIKNPVNTGRIGTLLELYPGAKFLFIYRNPVTVFASHRKLLKKLIPELCFHSADAKLIERIVFDVDRWLLDAYYESKALIPPENLMEIRFEEFESDPLGSTRQIYTSLLDEDFSRVEENFSSYLESLQGYKKNSYRPSEGTIAAVYDEWGKYMSLWNYDVPA